MIKRITISLLKILIEKERNRKDNHHKPITKVYQNTIDYIKLTM